MRLEYNRGQPAAGRVGLLPDGGAIRFVTAVGAVDVRRVGEQCVGDGGQQCGQPKLLAPVMGVGIVERALDAGGLGHHPVGQPAARAKVGPHDVVTRLGHPRHVVDRKVGVDRAIEPAYGECFSGLAHHREVSVQVCFQLGQRLRGPRGPLDLAARLQRERAPWSVEPDQVVAFHDRRPAAPGLDELQYLAHRRTVTDVRQRGAVAYSAPHFFEFHPHQPVLARACGADEVVQQQFAGQRSGFGHAHRSPRRGSGRKGRPDPACYCTGPAQIGAISGLLN